MPEISRLQGVVEIDGADDAQRKLAGVQSGFEGAAASAQKTGPAFAGAGMSITDFSSALGLAGDAIQLAGQAYEETIGKAAEWGDEMGDLAQITNSSVEETSRLAATLELMGVKTESLGRVVKAMNKEGLEFNLETLLRLNREYNAIQDPVAKTQFIFDKFGKSGQDMAEILGRDEAELRKLADAAEHSGKVIGEEAAAQAEAFNTQMAILGQMVEGAKIQIGGELIDVFHDAISTLEDWTEGIYQASRYTGEYTVWMGDLRNAIADANDELEISRHKQLDANAGLDAGTRAVSAYAARWEATANAFEPAIEASKEAEEYFRKVEEAAEKARQAESDAWLERFQLSLDGNPVQQENEQYASSMEELQAKAAELRGEIDKLTASHGQYYETVQGNGATAAQLELANQKLAAAYKKLSEETDPLKIAQLNVEIEKQQGIISGADQVVGGYINNSKKITELEGDYQVVEDAINDLKKAHEEATARIVLDMLIQKLGMDELTGKYDGEYTAAEMGFLENTARQWGIYEGSTIQVMQNVDKSISEHGLNAAAVVTDLGDKINGLPSTKEIQINVRTHYQAIHQGDTEYGDEDYGGWDGGGGGGGDNNDNNDDNEPDPIVDPDPEPDKPGSVDLGTPGSTGGLGQLVIQIYETGNPQETANAVIEILQDRGLVDRTLVT